jgi:deoxyribodipyrimidine photolyase-related protein
MNNAITLVFPHQLFRHHPAIDGKRTVYLIEETLFFNQFRFHKQKIILHRATLKMYEAGLIKKKINTVYIEAVNPLCDVRLLMAHLAEKGITHIYMAQVVDDWLSRRLQKAASKNHITLNKYASPGFLNELEEASSFFAAKKSYFQTDFYIWQRKQRRLLLDAGGGPLGGKWTYDADNRQKMPKSELLPAPAFPGQNAFVTEAIDYTQQHFSNGYGSAEPFVYPVTFEDAENWLTDFLTHRFQKFGIYEDAMVAGQHWLYHSVLTPMLNTGLVTPQQVIEGALRAAEKYAVPLNSLEGFIRQITGWREFIRVVYENEGRRQRTRNYWGFDRKIPAVFWTGETGIAPVDDVIQKVLKTGYSHHIERLMIMGNFMLLCEFDPNEVYRWFMEMYIDAFDWVMVPNVYGMTQFADGGLMTTKPYISGSNYVLKMSDYKKGPWCEVWDALFWRFMHVNRSFFLKNPRLGMLVGTFDKMPEAKREAHLQTAARWLAQLDALNGAEK